MRRHEKSQSRSLAQGGMPKINLGWVFFLNVLAISYLTFHLISQNYLRSAMYGKYFFCFNDSCKCLEKADVGYLGCSRWETRFGVHAYRTGPESGDSLVQAFVLSTLFLSLNIRGNRAFEASVGTSRHAVGRSCRRALCAPAEPPSELRGRVSQGGRGVRIPD